MFMYYHMPLDRNRVVNIGAQSVNVDMHTWWYEEGPPEFFVSRDVPDLLCHVDKPASHWWDATEIQDPTAQKQKLRDDILKYTYQLESTGIWILVN